MKRETLTAGLVVTADQIHSRSDRDRVPAALDRLAAVPTRLRFERTAGDEIQGVVADGTGAVLALSLLVRLHYWRAGIGVGSIEEPLPQSTRAGRGSAFVAARQAIEAAHNGPQGLCLRMRDGDRIRAGAQLAHALAGGFNGGTGDVVGHMARPSAARDRPARRSDPQAATDTETLLWLLADLWRRRSPEGWEVADLRDQGLTGRECAQRLDISPSAVSQRAASARYVEGRRAAELAARRLDALTAPRSDTLAMSEPDVVCTDVVCTDAVRTDAVRTDAVRTDAARTDVVRTDGD